MTDNNLTRGEYIVKQNSTSARDVRVEYVISWHEHRIDVRMQTRGRMDIINPDVLIQLVKDVLPSLGITAYSADVEESRHPVDTPWTIGLRFASFELRVRAIKQLDRNFAIEILPPAA